MVKGVGTSLKVREILLCYNRIPKAFTAGKMCIRDSVYTSVPSSQQSAEHLQIEQSYCNSDGRPTLASKSRPTKMLCVEV